MRRTHLGLLLLLAAVTLCASTGCGGGDGGKEFPFEPLTFPFTTPDDIVRMAAFGIPGWSGSEPHNGTDLIIDGALDRTEIVSPTNGTIRAIHVSENPFSVPVGQLLLQIEIEVNATWAVNLVFEPSTVDPALKADQEAALAVSVGQEVRAGERIGDLLVGTLGYPHLHYMVLMSDEPVCAYAHSSAAAQTNFEDVRDTGVGNNLPDGNICFGAP